MEAEKINYITLILPGLIAVLGNIVFYLIVKRRIDKSIEKHKISYAGVFKEKIEIHKEVLKQLYDLKSKIQQYQYSGNEKLGDELFLDFNKFINYYTRNRPFIKTEILNELKFLTKELQGCFDDFYMHNSLTNTSGIEPKIRQENLKKFFESGNKFKKNQPFHDTEELIIKEMRKDLKIEVQ